jgi:hypothetical protein
MWETKFHTHTKQLAELWLKLKLSHYTPRRRMGGEEV